MGLRDKKNSDRKLSIKKETLRKLALRPLTDDQLRAAAGGRGTAGCAPSYGQC